MRFVAIATLAGIIAPSAHAQDLYGSFTLNGETVDGTATATQFEEYIPLTAVSHTMSKPSTTGSARSAGVTEFGPVEVVLSPDEVGPLFIQAMARNQEVSAEILFVGPDPQTGETVIKQRMQLEKGRLMELSIDGEDSSPAQMQLAIMYHTMTFTDEESNTESQVSWAVRR